MLPSVTELPTSTSPAASGVVALRAPPAAPAAAGEGVPLPAAARGRPARPPAEGGLAPGPLVPLPPGRLPGLGAERGGGVGVLPLGGVDGVAAAPRHDRRAVG